MFKTILSFTLALASISALASPLPSKPHIYVEGSATIEVEPNEMSFSITIAHTAPDVSTAKNNVDSRSIKLIDLCKEIGISVTDIATTTLRVSPAYTYRNDRRVPDGTTVSRDIDILLRDLSQYPKIIQAFIDSDISQTISTKLLVSEGSKVTDSALEKALVDARQRASKLAAAEGKKLGGIYSISEFMTRGDERYMLHVSRDITGRSTNLIHTRAAMLNAPSEPFEPGVMVARAQVYVVYLLK